MWFYWNNEYFSFNTAWFYWKSEYFSFKFAKLCISQNGLVNAKMSQIGLKQAFFTKQKHCPTTFCSASLFSSENALFYWNSECFSFKFAKRCISQKGLVNAKMSQIGIKQAFFTKQKHCPTTFSSASLFWSENAWCYWNCEYFSFKFAKRCISQKGLVNTKMSQIELKQAFFHK